VRDSKNHKKSNPHSDSGTPRIGLVRDMSIFQIGESQNRYGDHSNLGTNTHVTESGCRDFRSVKAKGFGVSPIIFMVWRISSWW
jgi:hypothetical protein